MLHTALEFLKGSCGFWILSTVCRVILRILDLANCFAVGSFGSWILYPAMLWDPKDLGSCRAVLPSDPVDLGSCFWSRHVSDAHAVGTKRPEFKTHFSPATLCILLHLLSWENVSKALNPAGFTAFDKYLKTALM